MVLQYLLVISVTFQICFGFTLGLDVGHTDSNYGALSSGCVKEYDYNLNLAKYINTNLKNKAYISVVSNKDTQNVSFSQRYDLSKNKDLFISIHHDSVQSQYIHYDKNHCPQTNYAKGFSIFVSEKNKHFEKSLEYAKKFAISLVLKGLKPTLHHNENIKGENRKLLDKELGIYQFDDLKVLKNAHSPAFLFEAGVIVNPQDEHLIQTVYFKDSVVSSLTEIFQ